MNDFNTILLTGTLTRDPELRQVGAECQVCNLNLAVNRKYKDKESTVFVEVSTWNNLAENCSKYLQKASKILVQGSLQQESWEDKVSGQTRSKIKVNADSVRFLDRPAQIEPVAPEKKAEKLEEDINSKIPF
jgi:single-strand DNA-binding protein